MKYRRVKGCYDLYPHAEEQWRDPLMWNLIEGAARSVSLAFALSEIRTPAFEYTDVFLRTVGASSDIVSKEMYTFEDRAGRSISLRPEITAPVLRAFIENSLHQSGKTRLFYIGSCWRYDRAQKGRYRQFSQFGIELIGSHDATVDVEAITCLLEFYRTLGLKGTKLLINSIGDLDVRHKFGEALREYFTPHKENLSEDSKRRLFENPLRIIDSKDECDRKVSQNAPTITEFLTTQQKEHFAYVCETLDESGIIYEISPHLVRGLDYYCDTVFEVVAEGDAQAQNTLGAGGRYDGLLQQMGGPDLPGVGFATGIERVIQHLLKQEDAKLQEVPEFFFIGLNEMCKRKLLPFVTDFRRKKKASILHHGSNQLKKALSAADKSGAQYAVILGESELEKGIVKVKNLISREEEEISFNRLCEISQEFEKQHGR